VKVIFLNTANNEIDPIGIRKFLQALAPTTDIFCLQECHYNIQKVIFKYLQEFKSYTVFKYIDKNSSFSNAILVKKPIKTLDITSLMDNSFLNIGLAINLTLNYKNKNFNIINVHGVAFPGTKLDTDERLQQSKTILKHCSKLTDPIIIGGDFNLLPQTESIRMFEQKGFINLVNEYKIQTTRNKKSWKIHPGKKQLYADYTFTDSKIKVKHFKVPYIEISDHLPMILDFEL